MKSEIALPKAVVDLSNFNGGSTLQIVRNCEVGYWFTDGEFSSTGELNSNPHRQIDRSLITERWISRAKQV
jgi:hypothetical protein